MEFDKNKILTVVTADQAKVGQKGWFADDLKRLRNKVEQDEPMGQVACISPDYNKYRFELICGDIFSLFYPAPKLSYAERQAQWVKENNVKERTKVRVTRTFTEDEDGSCCWEHDDLVGMTGSVCEHGILSHHLGVIMSDEKIRAMPYFALEVIKEPSYRPYNNDELNDLVGEVLTNKQSGRRKLVTGKPTASEGVNLDGSYINAKDLLASFYRNRNEPCGVKEEV